MSGCGKKVPCPNAITGRYLASKAGVFRQTGSDLGVFSTRTQTGSFAGFFGKGRDPKLGIRGRFGRIWDMVWQGGSVRFVFEGRVLGSPHRGHLTRDGSVTCDRWEEVENALIYREDLGVIFPGMPHFGAGYTARLPHGTRAAPDR